MKRHFCLVDFAVSSLRKRKFEESCSLLIRNSGDTRDAYKRPACGDTEQEKHRCSTVCKHIVIICQPFHSDLSISYLCICTRSRYDDINIAFNRELFSRQPHHYAKVETKRILQLEIPQRMVSNILTM